MLLAVEEHTDLTQQKVNKQHVKQKKKKHFYFTQNILERLVCLSAPANNLWCPGGGEAAVVFVHEI